MTLRRKPRRRLAAGQRCHCCHCGKIHEPPDRRKSSWPCPECGEVTWSSKISTPRLKKIAWDLLSRLKRWDCRDDQDMCMCVTCYEKFAWNDPRMHAGHFVKRTHGATLFDWDNVQPQCCYCNTFQDGEQATFATWLRNNLGPDVPEALMAKGQTTKNWKRDELILLIEGYRANLRAEGLPDK